MENRLVKAHEIPPGGYFKKQMGEYVYLRISLSSSKHYGMDTNRIYGVCYNGNMADVSPSTMVIPATLKDMQRNIEREVEWESQVGVKHHIS